MGAFFTALFTVLGQNIATIISIALAGSGLYCIISPKGRLLIKSGFNWMFSTAANNPELAAGVYDEKIKELRGKLRKAEDINQKKLGEVAELNEKYEIAKRDFKKYSEQAVILERRGDHEQALLLARKASQAKVKAENYEAQLPELTARAEAAGEAVNNIQWKIAEVENRKEITVSNMKIAKSVKETAEELKGLNISEIDASLKQIEDNANDKKYQAIGAHMSYEQSEVKRIKDAEEMATTVDAEVFLQNLLNEDNNN